MCALRHALLEQMECVYHGDGTTSLVTSDVSPINTPGGGQLLKQQNMLVEKMAGRPGRLPHLLSQPGSGRGQPDSEPAGGGRMGG